MKPLGQNGAFGTAFTVEAPNPDTESHEPITMCMKVFNIHGNKRFNELTRIQRELTNLTILKNEEQILHLYGITYLPNGQLGLLTKYYKNKTLGDYMWDVQKKTDSLKSYNIEETFKDEIPIVKSLISAMRVLYDKKIMHRDLKPGNVCLGDDGKTCILIDFGFSSQVEGDKLENQSGVGTQD